MKRRGVGARVTIESDAAIPSTPSHVYQLPTYQVVSSVVGGNVSHSKNFIMLTSHLPPTPDTSRTLMDGCRTMQQEFLLNQHTRGHYLIDRDSSHSLEALIRD